MVKFLVRSYDLNDPGYREIDSPNGLLPRTTPGDQGVFGPGDGAFVPWAITPLRKVVYARFGQHRSNPPNVGGLRPYDGVVSQDRRRLAESALAMYALNLHQVTRDAVDKVSLELLAYLDRLIVTQGRDVVEKAVYDGVGHYYYTNGGKGFGRISEANKAALSKRDVYLGIVSALKNGTLDQRIGLHETLCRKVFFDGEKGKNFGTDDCSLRNYEANGPVLRQDWFDDKNKRGRSDVSKAEQPGPTRFGGVMTSQQGLLNAMNPKIAPTAIDRARGVDMFKRDEARMREPAADSYYDDLDARNLTFGAGISGTTGSCLQAAIAFSQRGGLAGEKLKQYVFAILGYLVGGGMHSAHESLEVARKVGLRYVPGKYIPSLPGTFLVTPEFENWRAEYYDIAVLGATHWRHNLGALPSHLNSALTANPALVAPRGDVHSSIAPHLAGKRK